MPMIRNKRLQGKPALSREEHSKLLTSMRPAKPAPVLPEKEFRIEESVPEPPVTEPEKENEPPKAWTVIQKNRQSITVEQTIQYNPEPNRPIVSLKLRLTTALAGERRENGLAENAYLFRLEVLEASGQACMEGFTLGPWQARNQAWGPGAVYVAEPLWAGFAFQPSLLKGRVLIADQERNRLLDLPWQTEGIIPGIKPLIV